MGNSAVSRSKRRLSDLAALEQELKERRERESLARERMFNGEFTDSGIDDFAVSREFNSSYSGNSEYLMPEPPCESKSSLGMRMATIASGIDINVRKLPSVFRWSGPGTNVFLSGSFDGWKSKIPLVRSRHDLYTIIDLPEGEHQYKFLVDNEWVCDEKEAKVPNVFGTSNNVLTVKSTDFEVFDALSIDSSNTSRDSHKRPGSPVGDYGQVVPPRDSKHGVRRSAPPMLPQHLLQVILNKDVARHCEPSLLHEPSHVMVNHLYALSIKDGLMIVSSTFRYRKKYITTILYKPC